MRKKRKSFSKAGKLLCLMLAVVLMLGAMPMYNTFASAGTDEPAVESVTPEPMAAPAPDGETEATPSEEPEVTPTPGETPAESPEPEVSPTPSETPTESPEPEATPYANSISGVLWIDADENGIYDSGESPLADYPVYLYLEGDTDNAVDTATTDADGKYRFEDISPGRYVVGIKAEENGTEYLLPLVGVQKDNKFYFTPDYSKVISNALDIEADTVVTDINAAMRTMPQIQPMANVTYTIDITDSTTVTNSITSQSIPGVSIVSNVLTFDNTVDSTDTYILTGTTTTVRVVINDGVGTAFAPLKITLNGASITNSASPFCLLGTASVNLTLSGTNTLRCTGTLSTVGNYQAGLYVAPSAALNISGSGTLDATGGLRSAGIGGSYMNITAGNSENSTGTIIINSGTVTASGNVGAGIGGGYYGGGGITTINGGTVTATATQTAAGIGGGGSLNGYGGTITITGGTVTATSAGGGAGIGGGGGSSGGTITISGGTVVATAQTSTYAGGAGIGGSGGGDGGAITISGGTVTATGSGYATTYGGAGIGGGGFYADGGSAGTITISGGRVTATGASVGITRDIGYGYGGSTTSGSIIITGGSVYPTRGSSYVGPTPTNGTANGDDIVHMLQFTGYSDNTPFYIVAGGSSRSYDYYANAHPNGTVHAWLIYPGILTKDATNITTTAADLNGDVYLVGNGYSVTSGYFQVTTTSGDYTSPVKTESITPTSTSTSGVIDSYSAGTNGLSSGTTYYYRFVIVTGGVTVYGNEVEFRTSCLVTENYLKIGDGSALQAAATSSVANGGSFTGSPPTTLTASGDTYTYMGYRLGSTTATLNSGTPSAITISADTNIYYYYAGPPIVTVSHSGASGTTATLNGTYNLNGGTFTSGFFEIYDGTSWITLTSTSAISITGATGVTASTGQVDNSTTTPTITITGLTPGTTYQYRFTVTTNAGTNTATGNFTAGYGVTEKFVDLSGSVVDATGLPDNTVYVTGSYTASGIPTSHTVSGDTYTYLGYKLDSYTTGDTLISGTPSSVTITGSRDVYYVYAIAEGSIKIEKYAHDGTTLLPGAEFQLEKLTGPGGTIDTTFTAQTLTTGAGGNVTFANLSAGSYRVTETKAPAGHELLTAALEVDIPKDITYAVGTPPVDNSYLYSTTSGGNVTYHYYDVTYKVSDQASIAMPSAGATNTLPPYALWGGSIILLAALGGGILWLKRRRAYAPKQG